MVLYQGWKGLSDIGNPCLFLFVCLSFFTSLKTVCGFKEIW